MNKDGKIKCPECGKMVNSIVEKDVTTFDSIFYKRRCLECGSIIERFSVDK